MISPNCEVQPMIPSDVTDEEYEVWFETVYTPWFEEFELRNEGSYLNDGGNLQGRYL